MSQPPNLIYVFADQLRYQSLGYAGDARAQTPNIDRLAAESLDFHNCVSGSPMCAPYRASLFSGKYSSSTGMVINELRINPNQRCFGHVLHDAGYDSYYIGKWHLWANQLGNHDDPRNSFTPPGRHRLGFDGYWAAYGFHHTYWDQYYHEEGADRVVLPGYEPDGQTDLAIAKLGEAAYKDRPFAMFLSLGTPHDPWDEGNVPAEYLSRFDAADFELPPNYKPDNDPHADAWARLSADERAALPDWMRVYYAMTANLDWNIGRLLDAIESLGLAQNSIIVFTSDHGEMFGAQGRRAKNIFYDEAVRVPFLLRWEGVVAPRRVDACLNTPDIMPTLLGAMNLPIPDECEGFDFGPLLRGVSIDEPDAALMQGMGATAIFEDGHEWRALRSKGHTFARYLADGSELLFDNEADPFQTTNLIDSPAHAGARDAMRRQLSERMAALHDSFERCTWYAENWIENRVIQRSATVDWSPQES